MWWRVLLALGLVGCGRIGFAEHDSDGVPDADQPDAAITPWSLVQVVGSNTSTVALAPTRAGDLLVVAIHVGNLGMISGIVDNATQGTDSYQSIAPARATDVATGATLELWYAENVGSGATSIDVTSNAQVISTVVWEVAGLRTSGALDTGVAVSDQPASNAPLGPSITTKTPGEFVVSVAIVANGISGTHAGNAFTNDLRTRGDGWAHLTDPAAPAGSYQAEWDQGTAGDYCSDAAAFRSGT